MRFLSFRKLAAATCLVAMICSTNTALANEKNGDVAALMKAMEMQAKRLADQEKKLDAQQQALERQRSEFAKERVQFEKLQMQFSKVTGKPIPQQDSPSPAQSASAGSKSTPQEVGTDRKQSTEKPPEIAAVIEEGGVLLQKGKLVVTPAMEYTHSTSTRVSISGFSIIPALNIGAFDISKVKRDILSPSVGLRYGITNRFEVDARVPYVYRSDATSTRQLGVPNPPETLTTVDGADIGDVEVGAHYQINDGQDGWPYFVGNMRFKTITGTGPFEVPVVNGVQTELPTGSGFYAFQPSVTAIFPSDPLVYYSNVGYLHSLGRNFPSYGKVEPGDSISASFGSSLSLNERSSISLGYSHSTVMKTKINDATVANSTILQVGSLDLGYSYLLNDTTNLNFTLSAGLTDDAPDIRLIFRTPMTFDIGGF
jgi:hypothetical protein